MSTRQSDWFYKYHNLLENAAVLEINGYYTKYGAMDKRTRWYRRVIYPDGEWRAFADQEGNVHQQEITYTQAQDELMRTTVTHEIPRYGNRQLIGEQTELLPSDQTPLRTNADKPNGFRSLDDITPEYYEIPTYQPKPTQ